MYQIRTECRSGTKTSHNSFRRETVQRSIAKLDFMGKNHSPYPSSRGTVIIPNPQALLNSFCSPNRLVMNLGHVQNYYNLAQQ